MVFFSSAEPVLRTKQTHLDIQDICGLLKIHWQIGTVKLWSGFYTRVDQSLLLWGLLSFGIFTAAQFLPISWVTQAYCSSVLTLLGTLAMVVLTQFWARVEQLTWIIAVWGSLMMTGLILTDAGIFWGWGQLLTYLCPLWLGLSAVGYVATGIGMHSRTFLLIGVIHLLGIGLAQILVGWQFLLTGVVMGGSLLVLSELQWDMRPPIESPVLSETEKQFNREQDLKRQARP